MKHEAFLGRLDDLIQSRSILEHPFYVAWQKGELTRDQLADYARMYYPHVEAFPHYLESAIAGSDDSEIRAELQDNLEDERSIPEPHPKLWLDFAAAFDLDEGDVSEADPHPATKKMVSTFDRLTSNGTAGAVTALYAYESQQPEVSRQKVEGLQAFYGVDDPQSLAYFEVHAEADIEHRAGERRAIARCLEAGATEEEILDAAGQALDAYWGLLEGVCQEAGIPMDC